MRETEKALQPQNLSSAGSRRVFLFLPVPEAGHTLPLIPVADRLRQLGENPVFLTSSNIAVFLRERSFEAHSYSSITSSEFDQTDFYASSAPGKDIWKEGWSIRPSHQTLVEAIIARIDNILGGRQVSLCVLDKLFYDRPSNLRLSLARRFRIVTLSTSFIYSAKDRELNRQETIVLCPESLLATRYRRRYQRVTYGEPSILRDRRQINLDVGMLSGTLVLCGFGSQVARYKSEVLRRTNFLCRLARELPSMTFLVAFSRPWLEPLQMLFRKPRNLIFHEGLPQLHALSYSSVFFTHAGLGSVKEAIFTGIPMLCWPLGLDQRVNAQSVEEAGLGGVIDQPFPSVRSFAAQLDQIMTDPHIRDRMELQRAIFRECEARPIVANMLQEIASR